MLVAMSKAAKGEDPELKLVDTPPVGTSDIESANHEVFPAVILLKGALSTRVVVSKYNEGTPDPGPC
jgi:hypothetical protein